MNINYKNIVIGLLISFLFILFLLFKLGLFRLPFPNCPPQSKRTPICDFYKSLSCKLKNGELIDYHDLGYVYIAAPYGGKECVRKYRDADKICFDNNDCEGSCILGNLKTEPTDETMGKCNKYRIAHYCYKRQGDVAVRRDGDIIIHNCPTN